MNYINNNIKYIVMVMLVSIIPAGAWSIAEGSYYVGGQCTTYSPVCGQKMVCPQCNSYVGVSCVGCHLTQQTYSNVCLLNQDSAQLLYYGMCGNSTVGGSTTNQPPTISSFSGPATLNVNSVGTWLVQASDPENRQLTYDVNWGDEQVYMSAVADTLQNQFIQNTTLQHSYANSGTYTITISVRDNVGNTVISSTIVNVTQQYTQPQPYPYQYYNYQNYQQPYYYWNYDNYYNGYYNNYYNDYYDWCQSYQYQNWYFTY